MWFGASGRRFRRQTFPPEPQGLQVDGADHLEGEERHAQEGAQQAPSREAARVAADIGIEHRLFGDGERHAQCHLLSRRGEMEGVVALDGIEGRNEEMLGRRLDKLSPDRNHIGVAAAECVVHFIDHQPQAVLGIETVIDGQRVEHIAKNARVAEHEDTLHMLAAFSATHQLPGMLTDRRAVPRAVIAVHHREQVQPVVAEQAETGGRFPPAGRRRRRG